MFSLLIFLLKNSVVEKLRCWKNFSFFFYCVCSVLFQWYQPDTMVGQPSVDGFVMLGSGSSTTESSTESESTTVSDPRLAKVNIRVSSARHVCGLFSQARRALEKSSMLSGKEEEKEVLRKTAQCVLLKAMRKGERVLCQREDEIDHRIEKTVLTITDDDLYGVNCDEESIRFLESCFNIDSGACGENEGVAKWFRSCIL